MPAIVCRDRALTAVSGALERPPALVLLEGEAGIGKTRLVRECLESKPLADRTVLMVECQPLADPVPLAPVVEGLRRLREHVSGVRLSPLAGAHRCADHRPGGACGSGSGRPRRRIALAAFRTAAASGRGKLTSGR